MKLRNKTDDRLRVILLKVYMKALTDAGVARGQVLPPITPTIEAALEQVKEVTGV